jgi:ribosomal protein S27E
VKIVGRYFINNIGIPHIFRCPKCDILLQINQDEIVKPYDIETESVEMYLEERKTIDSSTSIKSRVIAEEKSEVVPSLDGDHVSGLKIEEQQPTAQSKTVRIGGFFGKVYTVKKEGNKLVYQKADPSYENEVEVKSEESKVIRDIEHQSESKIWKPTANNTNEPSTKHKFLFTICPTCGNQITAKDQALIKCPYCGYKF